MTFLCMLKKMVLFGALGGVQAFEMSLIEQATWNTQKGLQNGTPNKPLFLPVPGSLRVIYNGTPLQASAIYSRTRRILRAQPAIGGAASAAFRNAKCSHHTVEQYFEVCQLWQTIAFLTKFKNDRHASVLAFRRGGHYSTHGQGGLLCKRKKM